MEKIDLEVWDQMAGQVMLHYPEKDLAYILANRLSLAIHEVRLLRKGSAKEIERLQREADFHDGENYQVSL